MSTWEAHFGKPFEGPLQPFGRLCYYLAKDGETHPMAPRTKPGFFCGWKLEFGARYRGALLVLDYDFGRKHGFKGTGLRIIPAKEVHFPAELVFPFAEARKLALERLQPVENFTIPTKAPEAIMPWDEEPTALGSSEPAEDEEKKSSPMDKVCSAAVETLSNLSIRV